MFSFETALSSYQTINVSYEIATVTYETKCFSYEPVNVLYEISNISYETSPALYEMGTVSHELITVFSKGLGRSQRYRDHELFRNKNRNFTNSTSLTIMTRRRFWSPINYERCSSINNHPRRFTGCYRPPVGSLRLPKDDN